MNWSAVLLILLAMALSTFFIGCTHSGEFSGRSCVACVEVKIKGKGEITE